MKQIDFGAMFHQNSPRKLKYEIRSGPNGDHDLVFMRSYIYDAKLNVSKVKLRGERLLIPILRECNELNDSRKGIFYIVESHLSFYPVIAIKWQLHKTLNTTRITGESSLDINLGIDTIYYTPSRFENGDEEPYDIVLGNPGGWKLIVNMSRNKDPRIILTDLKVPYINPYINVEVRQHCTTVRPKRNEDATAVSVRLRRRCCGTLALQNNWIAGLG